MNQMVLLVCTIVTFAETVLFFTASQLSKQHLAKLVLLLAV
jgi:hypothetical protein